MKRSPIGLAALAAACLLGGELAAQSGAGDERKLVIEPSSLELDVGETATLSAKVLAADGSELEEEVFFFSRARRSVSVAPNGEVTALQPGEFTVVARTARRAEGRLSANVSVRVAFPPVTSVVFQDAPEQHWTHVALAYPVVATDASGAERESPEVVYSTSDAAVASADPVGRILAHRPGRCTLTATVDGVAATRELEITANPVDAIRVSHDALRARTGDVVRFSAEALDTEGRELASAPIHWSFLAIPDDRLGPSATGQILEDGRFVAEAPGLYTVVATVGNRAGQTALRIEPRNVQGRFVEVGHGEVLDVHTSDLWVWEGIDGRDYAVTGTWGANGDALFWDVTDPADIQRIASVRVDARTVNDVKVSADGTLCVLSREGASNRKNGIVLVDVSNPREPKILSTFDEELTGGVHNVFIDQNTVYALSAGRRYDAIDIVDRKTPKKVGTYELDTPSHSIHDVWIEDGIAYSSNWSNGVHLVDVGNGVAGGSPDNPVHIADYAYPSGWNHAAFPYRDQQTGKFWVIAGDEAFPFGLHVENKPTYPRGWLHFIDFSDLGNPQEIARYEVPEAGSHNFWVDGDTLYAAMYNGGVRAVDLSGDLLGDLYHQGREIAWFLPTHHEGKVPNAPMVWGPQPHKGHVFFSDWNSGLWAAKLIRPEGSPSGSQQ